MSTIHTDSPQALLGSRLPTLFSQYKGGSFTADTQLYMTAEALHLIIQIAREPNGKRRITHITAVDGLDETNHIKTVDIFRYDRKTDSFYVDQLPPRSLLRRLDDKNVHIQINALQQMRRLKS